jgi:hypothetical protein
MKTTSNRFAITMLFSCPLLSGCGGGSSSTTPATPSLVGQFRQASITTSSASANCPGSVLLADGSSDSCGSSDTIQFRADSTFTETLSDGSQPQSGTWQFDGSTLTLKFSAAAGGSTASTPAVLSNGGNTLTISYTQGGTAAKDVYARQ